jgi:hypothetical protein
MRFISVGIVVGSLFAASLALAADGKGGSDNGKGGPGPGGGSSSPGGGAGNTGGQTANGNQTENVDEGNEAGPEGRTNPDIIDPFARASKAWEVGVVMTTHRLIQQGNLTASGMPDPAAEPSSGAAVNKVVNDYELYVRYDITKHDRVGIRAYAYEYFLADSGENGLRLDDMVFTYTHSITLPKKFNLDLGLLLTAPTSYESYLAGTVTTPRFTVSVDRRFGPLSLDARASAQYDIQTEDAYADGAGSQATSLFHVSLVADAELHMPFYEPLSVGGGIYTSYVWYHDIPSLMPAAADPTSGHQPIQQVYGGEAYIRYLMPTLAGFKPDITLAYSMGDPAIGYSSVLHDGVGHVYLGYVNNSELYLSMAVRY